MIPLKSVFPNIVWLTLLYLFSAGVASAEVRLPSIIGDNMVLQQGMKVRIWGKANGGEHVTVTFGKKSVNTVADQQGHWQVWLGPLKPAGPAELTIKGSNVLTIRNVLVGEVWICSGQSNMEWPLVNTVNGSEAVAQANYPEIRLFTVGHKTSESALDDVQGHWVVTTPDDAANFSAVGYFFGREIYQSLKVPIGLINTSWGGTPAEAWTSVEALKSSAELQPILDRYESSLKALPETKEAYERAVVQWEEKNLYIDRENKGEALGYADPATSTADWAKMDLPKQFEAAGLLIDGVVWFRKVVEVPASWAGKDLVLNLSGDRRLRRRIFQRHKDRRDRKRNARQLPDSAKILSAGLAGAFRPKPDRGPSFRSSGRRRFWSRRRDVARDRWRRWRGSDLASRRVGLQD